LQYDNPVGDHASTGVGMNSGRIWLLAAGWMSAAAAIAHFACIIGGPDWYIFLGAPRRFAYAAGRGELLPLGMAFTLGGMLSVWAAFAFSAAGTLRLLPLSRLALFMISAVLLVRGMGYFIVPNAQLWRPDLSQTFMITSSAICVVMGACFALGTWQAWPQLSAARTIP
jgi:hypothetical protein